MLRSVQLHSNITVWSRDTNCLYSNESEATECLGNALAMISKPESDPNLIMLIIGGETSRMLTATKSLTCGQIETVDESNGPLPLSWLAAFIVRMELWAKSRGHLVAFFEMGHICIAALLYKVAFCNNLLHFATPRIVWLPRASPAGRW